MFDFLHLILAVLALYNMTLVVCYTSVNSSIRDIFTYPVAATLFITVFVIMAACDQFYKHRQALSALVSTFQAHFACIINGQSTAIQALKIELERKAKDARIFENRCNELENTRRDWVCSHCDHLGEVNARLSAERESAKSELARIRDQNKVLRIDNRHLATRANADARVDYYAKLDQATKEHRQELEKVKAELDSTVKQFDVERAELLSQLEACKKASIVLTPVVAATPAPIDPVDIFSSPDTSIDDIPELVLDETVIVDAPVATFEAVPSVDELEVRRQHMNGLEWTWTKLLDAMERNAEADMARCAQTPVSWWNRFGEAVTMVKGASAQEQLAFDDVSVSIPAPPPTLVEFWREFWAYDSAARPFLYMADDAGSPVPCLDCVLPGSAPVEQQAQPVPEAESTIALVPEVFVAPPTEWQGIDDGAMEIEQQVQEPVFAPVEVAPPALVEQAPTVDAIEVEDILSSALTTAFGVGCTSDPVPAAVEPVWTAPVIEEVAPVIEPTFSFSTPVPEPAPVVVAPAPIAAPVPAPAQPEAGPSTEGPVTNHLGNVPVTFEGGVSAEERRRQLFGDRAPSPEPAPAPKRVRPTMMSRRKGRK